MHITYDADRNIYHCEIRCSGGSLVILGFDRLSLMMNAIRDRFEHQHLYDGYYSPNNQSI